MQDHIYNQLMSHVYGDNSVPIYGGALYTDTTDPDAVLRGILCAISDAKFREPQTPAETVAERFCALILVDPALYEAYLGAKFAYFDNVNMQTLNAFIQQWGRA